MFNTLVGMADDNTAGPAVGRNNSAQPTISALGAGRLVFSHVNDSGFWLVSRFFGMDVKTTFKTWTVMETTLGLSAFALAALLWPLAGAIT